MKQPEGQKLLGRLTLQVGEEQGHGRKQLARLLPLVPASVAEVGSFWWEHNGHLATKVLITASFSFIFQVWGLRIGQTEEDWRTDVLHHKKWINGSLAWKLGRR